MPSMNSSASSLSFGAVLSGNTDPEKRGADSRFRVVCGEIRGDVRQLILKVAAETIAKAAWMTNIFCLTGVMNIHHGGQ